MTKLVPVDFLIRRVQSGDFSISRKPFELRSYPRNTFSNSAKGAVNCSGGLKHAFLSYIFIFQDRFFAKPQVAIKHLDNYTLDEIPSAVKDINTCTKSLLIIIKIKNKNSTGLESSL